MLDHLKLATQKKERQQKKTTTPKNIPSICINNVLQVRFRNSGKQTIGDARLQRMDFNCRDRGVYQADAISRKPYGLPGSHPSHTHPERVQSVVKCLESFCTKLASLGGG